MSMTQLIIGTALGFAIAQSTLYGLRFSLRWLQQEEVRARIRAMTPWTGDAFVAAFIRNAAPIAASAALITLGVWTASDYLSAKTARSEALASTLDAASTAPVPPPTSRDEVSSTTPVGNTEPAAAVQPEKVNPYADPDYKVRHRGRRPGSLKETLLQRSEEKARLELLRDMQLHASRSQYDCEAADHAGKYLKSGLDVWGFAAWHLKYFPVAGYKGATLAGCKDIPNVIDPTPLDLESTVAQGGTHS